MPDLARFASFYYNYSLKNGGPVGVITYKDYAMQENSAVLDIERGQLAGIRPQYWQTDTSVSNKSWGYIENDTFKTPQFIVHQLVDVVSKNGNLLMNIGPALDGTIPDEVQQVLRDVGSWLKVNGEAIYGTRPWKSLRRRSDPGCRKDHFTTPTRSHTRRRISASQLRAMFSTPSNLAGRRSQNRSFIRSRLPRQASNRSNRSNCWAPTQSSNSSRRMTACTFNSQPRLRQSMPTPSAFGSRVGSSRVLDLESFEGNYVHDGAGRLFGKLDLQAALGLFECHWFSIGQHARRNYFGVESGQFQGARGPVEYMHED